MYLVAIAYIITVYGFFGENTDTIHTMQSAMEVFVSQVRKTIEGTQAEWWRKKVLLSFRILFISGI